MGAPQQALLGIDGTTSSILVNWTIRSTGLNADPLSGVAYNGSTFVAVGGLYNSAVEIDTSSNGTAWMRTTPGSPVPAVELFSIAYGNSEFCAVGYNGGTGTYAYTSSTGAGSSWTQNTILTPTTLIELGINYVNGNFIATGYYDAQFYSSSNGSSWTEQYTFLSSSGYTYTILTSAAYGNGTYVVVGYDAIDNVGGSTTHYFITTNTNLANVTSWVNQIVSSTNYLYGITYGNGLFCAVGANGTIITSPTGLGGSWTTQTSGTTQALNGVTYANGTFVVVGANGTILTSTNGTSWTARTSGTTANLIASVFGNSKWVVVGGLGSNGVILSSP